MQREPSDQSLNEILFLEILESSKFFDSGIENGELSDWKILDPRDGISRVAGF